MYVNSLPLPVVLVHGWKSSPQIWRGLVQSLEENGIKYWNFCHTTINNPSLESVATALGDFIRTKRREEEYTGPVDIVCHSMGVLATRYLLEVTDKDHTSECVRNLIGIGPPHNGSSMAEIFNHPVYGPEVIQQLSGVFVPRDYNPATDSVVQGIRVTSSIVADIITAGIRDDICYLSIIAGNFLGKEDFFPHFAGKTWVCCPDRTWKRTCFGDGVIPHADSYLPGTGFDLLPSDASFSHLSPDMYCHMNLPSNPEVIDRVMQYILNPATKPGCLFPY